MREVKRDQVRVKAYLKKPAKPGCAVNTAEDGSVDVNHFSTFGVREAARALKILKT